MRVFDAQELADHLLAEGAVQVQAGSEVEVQAAVEELVQIGTCQRVEELVGINARIGKALRDNVQVKLSGDRLELLGDGPSPRPWTASS